MRMQIVFHCVFVYQSWIVVEEVWIMLNEALNIQRRAKFAWASLGSVPNIYFQVSLELYRLCLLYYVSI